MKKFFILLTACTMGFMGSVEAMAADNSSMNNTNYNQPPTYEETIELIDTFIAVSIFDADGAEPLLEDVNEAIESLEGIDQVNAIAYLYIKAHDIVPECGFSEERRGELDEQLALYIEELFLGDPDGVYDSFVAWCDTLSDDEECYSYVAFKAYIELIESLASEM